MGTVLRNVDEFRSPFHSSVIRALSYRSTVPSRRRIIIFNPEFEAIRGKFDARARTSEGGTGSSKNARLPDSDISTSGSGTVRKVVTDFARRLVHAIYVE